MKTSNENKKKETAFEVIKETNEIYSCGKKKTGPRPIGKFPAPIHAARSSCPKKVPSGRKKKTFNKKKRGHTKKSLARQGTLLFSPSK